VPTSHRRMHRSTSRAPAVPTSPMPPLRRCSAWWRCPESWSRSATRRHGSPRTAVGPRPRRGASIRSRVPGGPRPVAAADLARIAEIERAIFPDPWSRQSFVETLARTGVRALAVDDGEGHLVGYGVCSLAADEGEILNLAVDPASRRRGIGRRLLSAMLSGLVAAGAGRVYLEVRGSNEAAITLYERTGFQRMGVRRAYYRRPKEDAVTMVLEVGSTNALK